MSAPGLPVTGRRCSIVANSPGWRVSSGVFGSDAIATPAPIANVSDPVVGVSVQSSVV